MIRDDFDPLMNDVAAIEDARTEWNFGAAESARGDCNVL